MRAARGATGGRARQTSAAYATGNQGEEGDRNQFNYVDRQHKQFLSFHNPDNIIRPPAMSGEIIGYGLGL